MEDLAILEEILELSAKAHGNGAFSLLDALKAYDVVLKRYGIPTADDTHIYRLLLRLSMDPRPNWFEKWAEAKRQFAVPGSASETPQPTSAMRTFGSASLAASAAGAAAAAMVTPMPGGRAQQTPSTATSTLRLSHLDPGRPLHGTGQSGLARSVAIGASSSRSAHAHSGAQSGAQRAMALSSSGARIENYGEFKMLARVFGAWRRWAVLVRAEREAALARYVRAVQSWERRRLRAGMAAFKRARAEATAQATRADSHRALAVRASMLAVMRAGVIEGKHKRMQLSRAVEFWADATARRCFARWAEETVSNRPVPLGSIMAGRMAVRWLHLSLGINVHRAFKPVFGARSGATLAPAPAKVAAAVLERVKPTARPRLMATVAALNKWTTAAAFSAWRLHTAQGTAFRVSIQNRTRVAALRVWHVAARRLRTEAKAEAAWTERANAQTVARLWSAWVSRWMYQRRVRSRLAAAAAVTQRAQLLGMLETWRERAHTSLQARLAAALHRKHMLLHGLAVWRERLRGCRWDGTAAATARAHRARRVATAVLLQWKRWVGDERRQRVEEAAAGSAAVRRRVVRAFRLWRHEYLDAVEAREQAASARTHWRTRRMAVALGRWREITRESKAERTRSSTAVGRVHRRLLDRAWGAWKAAFLVAMRVRQLTRIADAARRRAVLDSCFERWRWLQAKGSADAFEHRIAVARFWPLWRERYAESVAEGIAADIAARGFRRLRMRGAWRAWRSWVEHCQWIAEVGRQIAARSAVLRMLGVIRKWRARKEEGLARAERIQSNLATLRKSRALKRWSRAAVALRGEHASEALIVSGRRLRVMARLFERWHDVFIQRKRTEFVIRRYQLGQLAIIMRAWAQAASRRAYIRRVLTRREPMLQRRALKTCMASWHSFVALAKMTRKREALADAAFAHNHRSRFFGFWAARAADGRANRQATATIRAAARVGLLRRCVRAWQETASTEAAERKALTAVASGLVRRTLSRTFTAWHEMTAAAVRLEATLARHVAAQNDTLRRAAWARWRRRCLSREEDRKLAAGVLKLQLGAFWVRWRARHRSAVHCRTTLARIEPARDASTMKTCFRFWARAAAKSHRTRMGLARLKAKFDAETLRAALQVWHATAEKLAMLRRLETKFVSARQAKMCKRMLAGWAADTRERREETRLLASSATLLRRLRLSLAFREWADIARHSLALKRSERAVEMRLIGGAFNRWAAAFHQRAQIRGMIARRARSTLSRSLFRWRLFMRKEKDCKAAEVAATALHRRTVWSQVFGDWRMLAADAVTMRDRLARGATILRRFYLRSGMAGWHAFVAVRRREKALEATAEAAWRQRMLRRIWPAWEERYDTVSFARKAALAVAAFQKRKSLAFAMARWRFNAIEAAAGRAAEAKAVQHYRLRGMSLAVGAWMEFVAVARRHHADIAAAARMYGHAATGRAWAQWRRMCTVAAVGRVVSKATQLRTLREGVSEWRRQLRIALVSKAAAKRRLGESGRRALGYWQEAVAVAERADDASKVVTRAHWARATLRRGLAAFAAVVARSRALKASERAVAVSNMRRSWAHWRARIAQREEARHGLALFVHRAAVRRVRAAFSLWFASYAYRAHLTRLERAFVAEKRDAFQRRCFKLWQAKGLLRLRFAALTKAKLYDTGRSALRQWAVIAHAAAERRATLAQALETAAAWRKLDAFRYWARRARLAGKRTAEAQVATRSAWSIWRGRLMVVRQEARAVAAFDTRLRLEGPRLQALADRALLVLRFPLTSAAFADWRLYAAARAARRRAAEATEARVRRAAMTAAFTLWRDLATEAQQTRQAEAHRRRVVLSGSVGSWRQWAVAAIASRAAAAKADRFRSERLLRGAMGAWMAMAEHIADVNARGVAFAATVVQRRMRLALEHWLWRADAAKHEATLTLRAATYRDSVSLRLALRCWHRHTLRATRRQKLSVQAAARLGSLRLRNAFAAWAGHVAVVRAQREVVSERQALARSTLLASVLLEWHATAARSAWQKATLRAYLAAKPAVRLQRAFSGWRSWAATRAHQKRQLIRATLFANARTMQRALDAWHTSAARSSFVNALAEAHVRRAIGPRYLRQWAEIAHAMAGARAAKAKADAFARTLSLQSMWRLWKSEAAQRLLVRARLVKFFELKNGRVARGALREWAAMARESVVAVRRLEVLASGRQLAQLRTLWDRWTAAAGERSEERRVVARASKLRRRLLARQCLRHWRGVTDRRLAVSVAVTRTNLTAVLREWAVVAARRVRLRRSRTALAESLRTRTLARCLRAWRAARIAKGVAKLRRRVLRRTLAARLERWLMFAAYSKTLRTREAAFVEARNEQIVAGALSQWRTAFATARRFDALFQRGRTRVLRTVLATWTERARAHASVRIAAARGAAADSRLAAYEAEKGRALKVALWRRWRTLSKSATAETRHEAAARAHYLARLGRRAMAALAKNVAKTRGVRAFAEARETRGASRMLQAWHELAAMRARVRAFHNEVETRRRRMILFEHVRAWAMLVRRAKDERSKGKARRSRDTGLALRSWFDAWRAVARVSKGERKRALHRRE